MVMAAVDVDSSSIDWDLHAPELVFSEHLQETNLQQWFSKNIPENTEEGFVDLQESVIHYNDRYLQYPDLYSQPHGRPFKFHNQLMNTTPLRQKSDGRSRNRNRFCKTCCSKNCYHQVRNPYNKFQNTKYLQNPYQHLQHYDQFPENQDEQFKIHSPNFKDPDQSFLSCNRYVQNSDQYLLNSDQHLQNSDQHLQNADNLFHKSDQQLWNTDQQHIQNTDLYQWNTDQYLENTDLDFQNTKGHIQNIHQQLQNTYQQLKNIYQLLRIPDQYLQEVTSKTLQNNEQLPSISKTLQNNEQLPCVSKTLQNNEQLPCISKTLQNNEQLPCISKTLQNNEQSPCDPEEPLLVASTKIGLKQHHDFFPPPRRLFHEQLVIQEQDPQTSRSDSKDQMEPFCHPGESFQKPPLGNNPPGTLANPSVVPEPNVITGTDHQNFWESSDFFFENFQASTTNYSNWKKKGVQKIDSKARIASATPVRGRNGKCVLTKARSTTINQPAATGGISLSWPKRIRKIIQTSYTSRNVEHQNAAGQRPVEKTRETHYDSVS
ncbi:uncharacterized protein LOC143026829 [Oratosquilla oratoria]|uniref:uncharacterized protein LOC143026829 n=1 Tax=Oratosquilla oratoria TaxID=337810 RepID=UPI003F758961